MFYQSVISYGFEWRNKTGWAVEVKIGNFDSITEAAVFGRDAGCLLHFEGVNYLLFLEGEGVVQTIGLEDVTIRELKPESVGFLMTDGNDYQVVTVSEKEFLTLPEDFYSLGHGVIDNKGETIPLEELKKALEEIDKAPIPSTKFPPLGYSSLSSLERVYGSLTPEKREEWLNHLASSTISTKFVFNPDAEISPEFKEILEEGEQKLFREEKS